MAFSYPEKTGMVPHIGGSGSQSYNLIIAAVVVGWLFIVGHCEHSLYNIDLEDEYS